MPDARFPIFKPKWGELGDHVAFTGYKDLAIYKLAHELAIEIHELSLKLPKFEMYEVGSQIRRSSKSIASNIVEGFGRRRYKQEFIRFLIFAVASCDETRQHLDVLRETRSLADGKVYDVVSDKCNHLGRMIIKFTSSVERGHKTKK